jgi:AAA domain-containing protein
MIEEFKLTEFIELPSQFSSQADLMKKLDDAVARKKFCTLLGPLGCGKTWLLDYWRRTRKSGAEAIKPQEALYIHLRPATGFSLPMTCVVYSRLWYALQRLNRPKYLPDNEQMFYDDDDDDIKISNARDLQKLLPKVIDKAHRRNIRAVIIDNAHYMDSTSLEWLLDVWRPYDDNHGFVARRAIILVARNDLSEGRQLLKNLESIDDIKAAWAKHKLEIAYLSRVEFLHIISWLATRNLQAKFDTELNIQREAIELWKLTGGTLGKTDDGKPIELRGGRWRDVELLAADLDERLGSWDGKNPRIITREILDQLKAGLGQMKD